MFDFINSSGDDKLALFRQQAAIIARKKEGTAQRLTAMTEDVTRMSEELDRKREQVRGSSGVKVYTRGFWTLLFFSTI